MIAIIRPILFSFLTSQRVKKLIVDLLEALAKKTENSLDDLAVKAVKDALLPEWPNFNPYLKCTGWQGGLLYLVLEMIESLVSAAIAVITGGAILTSRTHARITEMEKRIDSFEVKVAEDYLSKKDFGGILLRLERSMEKMDEKLDRIISIKK